MRDNSGRANTLCLDQAAGRDGDCVTRAATGSVTANGADATARAAIAAAAADRLRQDAEGSITLGQNAAHGDVHDTAIATDIAVAADPDNATAGATIAATAANGLREHAVGVDTGR